MIVNFTQNIYAKDANKRKNGKKACVCASVVCVTNMDHKQMRALARTML